MTADREGVHPEEPVDEVPQLASVLDEYLRQMQAGNQAAQSALLHQFPEISDFMQCLETLEAMAPGSGSRIGLDSDPDATCFFPSGTTDHDLGGLAGTSVGLETNEAADEESRFGRYVLIEEIGRGGMGVIFKARQRGLDRIVALKLILANRLASAEEIRRFYLEAKAAGGLKHPNIVGVHEVGEVHGQHFFAMDFIDGESLADVMNAGRLDSETIAQCLYSVARAVQHLHDHGVIHRDLKPSNILIDSEGTPFVTDFGLAKVQRMDSECTQTGTIIGTPSYMSPEQAAGSHRLLTERSDVYSLGAILYELLTGIPPFREANALDTLVQVLEVEPKPPSRVSGGVPRELERICLKCLEKDPANRYESAAALAEDLQRFLTHEPVSAHDPNVFVRLKRWARREPAFVSQIVSVAVAAVIVQTKYMISGFELELHKQIMSLFGIWAITHFAFKKLLERDSMAELVRYGWLATDSILLTAMLYLSGSPPDAEPLGPLLIAYPLLVVASGLFSSVRLVWFTTAVSVLTYAVLPLTIARERAAPHYPIIYGVLLLLVGFITAYQVHRLRLLSRFCGSRND